MLKIFSNFFRRRYLIVYAFVGGCTMCAIFCLMYLENVWNHRHFLIPLLIIWLLLMPVAIYECERFCTRLLDSHMEVRLGTKILREVDYADIGPIFMVGMISDNEKPVPGRPIKRQQALLSIHSKQTDYLENGISPIAVMQRKEGVHVQQLASIEFDSNELELLLSRTTSILYVTEAMMKLYENEIKEISNQYRDRVFVRCTYAYVECNKY